MLNFCICRRYCIIEANIDPLIADPRFFHSLIHRSSALHSWLTRQQAIHILSTSSPHRLHIFSTSSPHHFHSVNILYILFLLHIYIYLIYILFKSTGGNDMHMIDIGASDEFPEGYYSFTIFTTTTLGSGLTNQRTDQGRFQRCLVAKSKNPIFWRIFSLILCIQFEFNVRWELDIFQAYQSKNQLAQITQSDWTELAWFESNFRRRGV